MSQLCKEVGVDILAGPRREI